MITEVLEELQQLKVDVAVIIETERICEGSKNLGKHNQFYIEVSNENRAQEGIFKLIYRRLRKYRTSWKVII